MSRNPRKGVIRRQKNRYTLARVPQGGFESPLGGKEQTAMQQKYGIVLIIALVTIAALIVNGLALNEISNRESELISVVQSYQDYNDYLIKRANAFEAALERCQENCPEPEFKEAVEIQYIEVPVIVKVRDGELDEFESVHKLRQWLESDNTSEQKWVFDTHDCDDFAMDLVRAAHRDNYDMGIYVKDFGNHTSHLMCSTIIGNGIWIIEPKTDGVKYAMQVDENLRVD